MKFSEDSDKKYYRILQYDKGFIDVNGKRISNSLIISPDRIKDWEPTLFSDMMQVHIYEISKLKPEVIILGTGAKQIFPPREILKALVETRVGFEIMSTSAACRTYNIIAGEGRNVVAGLMMI
jgi:uncharacterized protein